MNGHAAREHKDLYNAIGLRLRGTETSTLTVRDGSGPIHDAHAFACRLLSLQRSEVTAERLRDELKKKVGWWEREDRRWNENGSLAGGIGSGINHHILVFQPAVRLSFLAVGRDCGWEDPAFDWTVERHKGTLTCKDVTFHLKNNMSSQTQLTKIENAFQEYPEHEAVCEVYGYALVVNGQFENAQRILENALAMPMCVGSIRADAFYNLACAFARQGDERNCRRCLQESAALSPLNIAWMHQDPDFESIRDRQWFKQFLREEPETE